MSAHELRKFPYLSSWKFSTGKFECTVFQRGLNFQLEKWGFFRLHAQTKVYVSRPSGARGISKKILAYVTPGYLKINLVQTFCQLKKTFKRRKNFLYRLFLLQDIDALDERTEENKSDYEHLVQEFSLLQDSNRNSMDENQRKMEELKSKLSGENLRREIDTRIMVKDLVTKADLSRGLKTIPFGLSRDDVAQMIDFATSNFLRTVQGKHFQSVPAANRDSS